MKTTLRGLIDQKTREAVAGYIDKTYEDYRNAILQYVNGVGASDAMQIGSLGEEAPTPEDQRAWTQEEIEQATRLGKLSNATSARDTGTSAGTVPIKGLKVEEKEIRMTMVNGNHHRLA